LLFVVFCFLLFWNKKKFLSYYGVAILLFLFSLKFEFGVWYFSVFLSVLMSLCFFELLKMKWESKLVRDLILLIVLCGLVFSGLSYVNRISNEKPEEKIFELLDKLPGETVVLSDIGYGNWIKFSGRKNVWDSFTNEEKVEEIREETKVLFESEDYGGAMEVLGKYGVDFILMDKELREKWGGSGLLYLLRYNNEDFRLMFEEEGVEIWRVFR
jgi:hypothetical protein